MIMTRRMDQVHGLLVARDLNIVAGDDLRHGVAVASNARFIGILGGDMDLDSCRVL